MNGPDRDWPMPTRSPVVREPGSWMNRDSVVALAAVIAGGIASIFVLVLMGGWYVAACAPWCFLYVPLQRRWGLPSVSFVFFSVAWPAGILYLPYMVVVQERLRKERVARDVMET